MSDRPEPAAGAPGETDIKPFRCRECGTLVGQIESRPSGAAVLVLGFVELEGDGIATCPECKHRNKWTASNKWLERRVWRNNWLAEYMRRTAGLDIAYPGQRGALS